MFLNCEAVGHSRDIVKHDAGEVRLVARLRDIGVPFRRQKARIVQEQGKRSLIIAVTRCRSSTTVGARYMRV